MTEEHPRRTLIQLLLGTGFMTSILSFLYPAIRFMIPPRVAEAMVTEARAAGIGDLQPGSAALFRLGNRPGIVVRDEEGEWRAFSAVCTHLNCTVQYNSDQHAIWCACHNGFFDLKGRVISGPPPEPLEEFAVNLRGEDVMVSKRS